MHGLVLRLKVGVVVNYTQVNVSQEFARNICNLFVFLMVLYCVLVVEWLRGTKLHEVDANAVVDKRLTMKVTDGSVNLEELLILLNCCLGLAQVVMQNTGGVISTSFVS